MLDTLAEINERHEAVKELEKSLMELHQIFLDMAVLVEAQGEMLDNIEQQVCLLDLHRQLSWTCIGSFLDLYWQLSGPVLAASSSLTPDST